jgi:hypothetical protein
MKKLTEINEVRATCEKANIFICNILIAFESSKYNNDVNAINVITAIKHRGLTLLPPPPPPPAPQAVVRNNIKHRALLGRE